MHHWIIWRYLYLYSWLLYEGNKKCIGYMRISHSVLRIKYSFKDCTKANQQLTKIHLTLLLPAWPAESSVYPDIRQAWNHRLYSMSISVTLLDFIYLFVLNLKLWICLVLLCQKARDSDDCEDRFINERHLKK